MTLVTTGVIISSNAVNSPVATPSAPSPKNMKAPSTMISTLSMEPDLFSEVVHAQSRAPLSIVSAPSAVTGIDSKSLAFTSATSNNTIPFIQLSDSDEEENSVVEISNSFEDDEIPETFILNI